MRVGVDLGGTKVEAIAIDRTGREVARHRVPTPKNDYAATVAAIAQVVRHVESVAGVTGTVGIGTPGAISPATGVIKNANSVVLNDRPLDQDVAAALGRPIRMANDADCFALSEATDGAAAGATTVFGVILGTGVGGGIVIDGGLVAGPNAIAGEWGHNPLPYAGDGDTPFPSCYCGRVACVETYLSGPGMERDHRQVEAENLAAREIARRAAAGDEPSARTLERYADRLARSLATVINILDPHVVVLGGGVSNVDFLYERVPELWEAYVFSDTVVTRLVRNQHGDSGGVRGAAWLWPMSDEDSADARMGV